MIYAVRDLTQYDEFQQVREVQQQIWGFAQGEGLYPPALKTAAENGGVVIGAFDGGKLIGFLFGPAIWFVAGIWVIYRVIRGYLLFKESQPIPDA